MEEVAHLAVAGEEGLFGPSLAFDAEMVAPVLRDLAEQEPGGGRQMQRAVVEREDEQGDEQAADPELARPPRRAHEMSLEPIGHTRGIDHLDGEGQRLVSQRRDTTRDRASRAHQDCALS